VLALCPGAEFGEAKRWPAEHYAEVADAMIRQGWQVWLFGSKNDHPVGESIRDRLIPGFREESTNLSGGTSLAEAIDLLSCADSVVSNDSGLMHVAAALNRPLVAVYGSTSPGFTPPLAEQVEIVRLGIQCSPCFDRTCRFGHYNCLRLLEPESVIMRSQTWAARRWRLSDLRVLLIKTSSLGDVIHCLPAITDAARALPGIQFDWVVEEGFAEIPTWHPAVGEVIPVAIRRWRKNLWQTFKTGEWRRCKQRLRDTRYDLVIDAQGLLKSAWLTR